MTCMNRPSRTSSPPATIHAPREPIYSRRAAARPRGHLRPGPRPKPRPGPNTRRPVSPQSRRRIGKTHSANSNKKVLPPCRHNGQQFLCVDCGEGGNMAHDVGSASRSVLLLDALLPFRPCPAPAQRRAGGPCLFIPSTNTNTTNHATNDFLMGHSETNARLGGGGLLLNLGHTVLSLQRDPEAGVVEPSRQEAARKKTHRAKQSRCRSRSPRPQGPDGRPAAFLF